MLKHTLTLLTLALLAGRALPQNPKGTALQFRINGIADTTVFLASYHGNKLYYADTAQANKKGLVTFGNKKPFDPGMYAVVVSGKYFEVVLNNEPVEIETDKTDLAGKVKVKKSKENTVFYAYMDFLQVQRQKVEALQAQRKNLDPASAEAKALQEQVNAIDREVREQQQKIYTDHPASLAARYIWLSSEVQVPEAPKNPDGSPIDSLFAYKYAKAHYFDHLDFTDDRMTRAPFFQNRFDFYFKNMVIQIPDSVIAEIRRLMPLFEKSKEQFKYVCNKLTYEGETSKILCYDKVFVYMVNTYYKTGRATWLSQEKLKKVIERANDMEPCICNVAATPLTLPDSAMQWKKLYDLQTDYTILVFWSPDCGHCKKDMPAFAEMMKKFKDKSVGFYSVCQEHTPEWKKFIRDNHMEDFVNVAVPLELYSQNGQNKAHEYVLQGLTDYKSLNYRNYYDIITTPRIYLLDKNKVIIAKHLGPEQMEDFLNLFFTEKARH